MTSNNKHNLRGYVTVSYNCPSCDNFLSITEKISFMQTDVCAQIKCYNCGMTYMLHAYVEELDERTEMAKELGM